MSLHQRSTVNLEGPSVSETPSLLSIQIPEKSFLEPTKRKTRTWRRGPMGGECPRRERTPQGKHTRRRLRATGCVLESCACVLRSGSRVRATRVGCVSRKGGTGYQRAHAPTWASIRAAHATLSLFFVTRIGAHTARVASPRSRTQVQASTCHAHVFRPKRKYAFWGLLRGCKASGFAARVSRSSKTPTPPAATHDRSPMIIN